MFSLLIIAYLFLGGCAGGLLFIVSLWSLLFHRDTDRTTELTEVFTDVKNHAYLLGFLLLLLSIGFLVADLGRPDRMFMLITRPTVSILTFGAFVLLAHGAIGGFLLIANFFYIPWVRSWMKKAAEALCAIASFLLIGYTGLFLFGIKAIAFWDSIYVPLLFVLSSLSSGLAIAFLIAPFMNGFSLIERRMGKLHATHRIILILELITVCLFIGESSTDVFALSSLRLLLGSDLRLWFIIGACGCGILVPMTVELVAVFRKQIYRVLPFDVLCLFGAFCLRYCIVSAGMH